MIMEAADVHGAQASAITRAEGFYRPEVDELFFGAFISVLLTQISQSSEGPTTPCCQINRARFSPSVRPMSAFLLGNAYGEKQQFHSFVLHLLSPFGQTSLRICARMVSMYRLPCGSACLQTVL
jgi:hypothetical protein